MIKSSKPVRRDILKGLGITAAAFPLLNGLLRRVSQAQEGETRLRFCVMFTGNGQLPEHWIPGGSSDDFTLSPVLQAMAPLKSKLLLARGMHGAGGHEGGISGTLTGRPGPTGVATGGPSIDQFFANEWLGSTPLPSLELGVFPENRPEDQTFYSKSGLPVPVIGSPIGAFSKLTGATNLDPAQAALNRSLKGSVLDVVAKDIGALQGKLGSASRSLLDEHLNLIRQQEQLLQNPPPPVTCDFPGQIVDSPDLLQAFDSQNANAIAALRCGITRVVGIRVGGWGGIESGHYDVLGVTNGHHDTAHGGGTDPGPNLLKINEYHCQQFSKLAQALEAVPEGDGTLLDYTILLWVNEFGLGNFDHDRADVHVTMVGGSKAGFKNNHYVQLRDVEDQDFLYTLAKVVRPDLESFGTLGKNVLDDLLV